MVETSSDQAGVSGIEGERGDFDVTTVKEATSLSMTGVVIGGGMIIAFLLLGIIAGPDDAGGEVVDPSQPAAAEEVADAAAEAAAETEAEAAEPTVDLAPLGDYTVTFPGSEPISTTFSEDGTYDDGGIGGTWTYDSDGVWCFSGTGSDIKVCFRKESGSFLISTWANVENAAIKFTLRRAYYDAMDPPAR